MAKPCPTAPQLIQPEPTVQGPSAANASPQLSLKPRKSRKRVSESDLLQEKMRCRAKNIQAKHKTEDDKIAERRAANRLSAFQSRQRRKVVIETLQHRVSELSSEIEPLQNQVTALRNLCVSLHQQNMQLRQAMLFHKPTGDLSQETTLTDLLFGEKKGSNCGGPMVDKLLGEVDKIRQLQQQLQQQQNTTQTNLIKPEETPTSDTK